MMPDVHTLTGAYALDAIDEVERAAFERHLLECPDCAQEVREFHETAARLGTAVATTPPRRLREQVLAEVARTRQHGPGEPAVPARVRAKRRWPTRVTAVVAAAAVVAAVVLGVDLANTRSQLNGTQTRMASISKVLQSPDAVASKGSSDHGHAMAVVSASKHKAVLMASGMPPISKDKTYQLWFIGAKGAHSAGVLHRGADGKPKPVIASTVPGAEQVGMTVEPAGGSKQPTSQPVLTFGLT